MKSIVLTFFIIPLLFINQPKENDTPVVLELFTSQGCSSCPPADRLLKEVKNDNIIALSYHVDYWNYIGWVDPFSKSVYTDKQRSYASKFFSSSIYTPQLVVNGREHFVGSNRSKMKQKIAQYAKKTPKQKLTISDVEREGEYIKFKYNVDQILNDENLRIVLVIKERTTSVKRGENRNKTIVNSNIVVAEQQFQLESKTGNGALIVPDIVNAEDELSLVLITQTKTLDILSAAQSSI